MVSQTHSAPHTPAHIKDRRPSRNRCFPSHDLLDICEYVSRAQFEDPGKSHTEARISVSLNQSLGDIEKAIILAALREFSFNRSKTAHSLGISLRTLERRLKRYLSDFSTS